VVLPALAGASWSLVSLGVFSCERPSCLATLLPAVWIRYYRVDNVDTPSAQMGCRKRGTMMLAGIHPIVPTPFDEKGAIDVDSIETMTGFMVRCGVDGLAILGVMGEADRLTDRERDRVVEAFRQTLPRDRALVVGAGAAGTDAAIQACERALEMGADALLVGPPRIQNDAVLFSYYERIAQAVSAPIIVHDYPPATGVIFPPRFWRACTRTSRV
jgi:dihydrodipicolinate synthase/N-acetylneuraminate lyase